LGALIFLGVVDHGVKISAIWKELEIEMWKEGGWG
jgi:hypothetical protein